MANVMIEPALFRKELGHKRAFIIDVTVLFHA
jgi:hypothetical protein